MKRLLVGCLLLFMTIATYAQKDITTFLGIPVDGTKVAMIQKLISKGFVPKKAGKEEYLEGKYNGTDVLIYIVTNNDKVCRIMVSDVHHLNEAEIKIRFNKLVHQFENNEKYQTLEKYTLSESENISHEMTVNHKKYDAIFYQVPIIEKLDTEALGKQVENELLKKYTPEEIATHSKTIDQEADRIAAWIATELMYKKMVWFRICDLHGKYFITMFYDNEYNKANGNN